MEERRPETSSTILERLRQHLAWRADFGVELTTERLRSLTATDVQSCCDLGCGNGALLLSLKNLGCEVVGVEPDPQARHIAQERGVEVLNGTAEVLPDALEEGRFDVVFMIHVLEHTPSPIRAIENAVNLLRPGGHLVVETPNNRALGCRLSGATWPWLDVPRHLNFFTEMSLRAACGRGAVVRDVEYRGYCRQFSRTWLDNEQAIWTAFHARGPWDGPTREPRFRWRAWRLLLATILAPRDRKYDSVRVWAVCRR